LSWYRIKCIYNTISTYNIVWLIIMDEDKS
jgi:hypothetical protein